MNSPWIRIAGSQFVDQREQTHVGDAIAFAPASIAQVFGQSRAADMFGQFRDQGWLTLSAARLNLPGDRIADAFGPEHGWTAHGDRSVIDAIDRPLPASELNILG